MNVMQYCRDPCSLLCPSKTAGAYRTTAAPHHRYKYSVQVLSMLLTNQRCRLNHIIQHLLTKFVMIRWSLPKYCWSGLLGKQLYSALETFLFFSCCCCADTAGGVLDGTGRIAVSRVRAMSAGLLVGVLECVSSTNCVTASSWHCSWGGITAAAAGSSADCVAGTRVVSWWACWGWDWVPTLRALCACALLNDCLVLAMMLMRFSRVAGSLHRFFRTRCWCTDPEAV